MLSRLSREAACAALSGKLPSERMDAASWFLERGAPDDLPLLRSAETAEAVPRIRSVLSEAIRRLTRAIPSDDPPGSVQRLQHEARDPLHVLNRMSGVIRHELSAAVGWVRYTATKELPTFEASDTNTAIQALTRRINGLVAIVEAQKAPESRAVSINEALQACLPPQVDPRVIDTDVLGERSDEIETDVGLLSLILSNALMNAFEASNSGRLAFFVNSGVSDKDFWITISNSFDGATFEMSDVSASGVTTKLDHRGIGVYVMTLAAERLGYEIGLRGIGGVATFTLRGPRGSV